MDGRMVVTIAAGVALGVVALGLVGKLLGAI